MAIRCLTLTRKLRTAGTVVLCLLVVFLPLRDASAQPPPEVINRATVEYFHVPTGMTNEFRSEPVRVIVSAQTNVPLPEIHFYRDGTFAAPIAVTTMGQPLYVQ